MNADQWNDRYKIGTPVVAYPAERGGRRLLTRTRSTAWTLGHGAAVVAVDGYAGGICLTHVDPFRATDTSPEANAARWVPNNPHPLCRDFQQKPDPAAYWCANCGWNEDMHRDEARRTAIAAALECLPETEAAR
ncbi:hypothetical protein ACWET9_24740 [Streptomyces sp. NPDC004059]